MEGVAQLSQVLEVKFVESLERLELHFSVEGAKLLKKMEKTFEDCNVCAHREVANWVAKLSKCFYDVCKIDFSSASALDTSPDGKR